MAVSLLGQAAITESAPTYTAETGTDRLLVFVIQGEDPTGALNPSFSTEDLVDVTADTNAATGIQNCFVYAGYILDASVKRIANSIHDRDWTFMVEQPMGWHRLHVWWRRPDNAN